MELNQQFELIRQSATVAMADRVHALRATGHRIIGLQTGDPDFATPEAVLDVAIKAMQEGLTHYGPSRGRPELLSAIAGKLARDEAVIYDPESEILATHGGIHAYYTAMQAILNPGDEVLVPDPSWATHSNMVIMLRGKVVRVPAPAENGFIPHFPSWRKALTPRTRAIVLNYPSNPTGAYPTRAYLQELQDFAKEHDLWIVSDEVYGSLYYGERPTCAAAFEGAKDRTLLVNSLSKSYAMTGWRVGFLAAPAARDRECLEGEPKLNHLCYAVHPEGSDVRTDRSGNPTGNDKYARCLCEAPPACAGYCTRAGRITCSRCIADGRVLLLP